MGTDSASVSLSGSGSAAGSVVLMLLFMVMVFVAAYYVTKFIGRRYAGQAASTREMRMLDRMALGHDRYLLIVETGGKILLLGVTPQQISYLTELDGKTLAGLPERGDGADFFSILKSRMSKKTEHGEHDDQDAGGSE